MSAQLTALLIYSVWVLAVGGAIGGPNLAAESGTALIPLAGEFGAVVRILGSIFVILGMGMGSIHFSLGLYNLMRERLPDRSCPTVALPRRRGRVLLGGRGGAAAGLRIAITYLGLDDERPRLRLDVQQDAKIQRVETTIGDSWQIGALQDRLPGQEWDASLLSLKVVQASAHSLSLQISSSLKLSYEGELDAAGLAPADLLELDEAERKLVAWLVRRGTISLDELASHLGEDARETLDMLLDQGLLVAVEAGDEERYRVLLGHRRARGAMPEIWQALDEPEGPPTDREDLLLGRRSVWDRLLSGRGRTLLALSPVLATFLLAQWQLLAGGGSFSELIGFVGVIVVSLLAGIFPVLLLISSRRKGDYVPGTVYRFFGNPLLLGIIYVISLSSLFLHGLVIWESPVQRIGALVIGMVMLFVTFSMIRQGAFTRRMVVELRDGEEGAAFSIVVGGEPVEATVRLIYPEGERQVIATAGEVPDFPSLGRAIFQLAAGPARELKLWLHRVTGSGESEGLYCRVDLTAEGQTSSFDLPAGGEPPVVPLQGSNSELDLEYILSWRHD
jgi:hypothetical protein